VRDTFGLQSELDQMMKIKPLNFYINLFVMFPLSLFLIWIFGPIDIPTDAHTRFNTPAYEDGKMYFYFVGHELLPDILVYVSNNVFEFYVLLVGFVFICTSLILNINPVVFFIFTLSPPGYLLLYNITPSLLGFAIINRILLGRFSYKLFWFGLTSHLVVILALTKLINFKSVKFYVLCVIIFFVLSNLAVSQAIFDKVLSYKAVDGNRIHVLVAFTLVSVMLFFSIFQIKYRFICVIYILIVVISLPTLGTKFVSRMSFGIDLLFFTWLYDNIKFFTIKAIKKPV